MDGADNSKSTSALMLEMGKRAKAAARVLAVAPTAQKNKALTAAAAVIRANTAAIKSANAEDMTAGRAKGLTSALMDRLDLTDNRIAAMAQGLDDIAALADPVGTVLDQWTRPN